MQIFNLIGIEAGDVGKARNDRGVAGNSNAES